MYRLLFSQRQRQQQRAQRFLCGISFQLRYFDVHLYQCHNYCHVQYFLKRILPLRAYISKLSCIGLPLHRLSLFGFLCAQCHVVLGADERWMKWGKFVILAKHATTSKMLKRDSVVVFLLPVYSLSLLAYSSIVVVVCSLLSFVSRPHVHFAAKQRKK